MARTAQGARLTTWHRGAQLSVRAAALQDLMRVWPVWKGDRESFGLFVTATLPLVRAHYRLSSALAATYYRAFRSAEGVGGTATPRLAPPPDDGRVEASLWVTGNVGAREALTAGIAAAARQTALVRVSGAYTRHVLAGGRNTLLESTLADEQATGWARVTSGKPCAFCAMLAGRGPVFKSEGTADFQAHDHCSCAVEPAYEGSDWPGRAREFHDAYNAATREARDTGDLEHGTSNDLLNAFRRSWSG